MEEDGAVGDAAGALQVLDELDEGAHLRVGELAALAVSDEADADRVLVEPARVGRRTRGAVGDMGARLLRKPARTLDDRAIASCDAFVNCGMTIAARMPRITTTMRISMSVNPRRTRRLLRM